MLIIIATAISESVFAIEFTLISPESVDENSEFEVSIVANTAEVYDVKVFVPKVIGVYTYSRDITSQIYNGEVWRNAWYYIESVFPQQYIFRKKVINFTGETEICARLRIPEGAVSTPVCNSITINADNNANNEQPQSNSQNNPNENDDDEEDNNSDDESGNNNPINSTTGNAANNIIPVSNQNAQTPNKIVLNTAKNKNSPISVERTKESKIRQGVIYSFVGLCIILIVLLAWRKL